MFALSLYAMYRARRFHHEFKRREAAEAALKQAQRLEALGQLTGGVAHDFNNLLMVVSGNVQRLKKFVAGEGAERSFEAIEIAVKRGSDLTRQLLSFARRQTHEARVIDLARTFPALERMLQSSLRGDIAVETRIAPGTWRVCVDQSEFELALLNLAVNARDAMPSGGRFVITARNVRLPASHAAGEGEFVAIGAEDTGEGIPPDVLARVFEPFFTTKDVGKGTGLGLSQVYGFARQAGGSATVESKIGAGTKVTLFLPRSLEEPAPEAARAEEREEQAERGRGLVLLVEDNLEVADVTRGLLQDLGYDVLVRGDVMSALTALQSNPDIDVLLSDIVMPGGASGLDLAHVVRNEHWDMPIILATGFSQRAQTATDEGFTILRKPYGIDDLREALEVALRGRRRRMQADVS